MPKEYRTIQEVAGPMIICSYQIQTAIPPWQMVLPLIPLLVLDYHIIRI